MRESQRNRRHFLHDTAALAATIAALPAARVMAAAEDAPAPAKPSANETIRVAVVGVKGRGMSHVEGFSQLPNVKVTAICDIDENVIGPAKQYLEKVDPKSPPKFYQDIRKLLEDKDVDVVSIATPNHWHALAAIWACQAGKDVYVEKPVSHNVSEGRRIVDAARHYDKIVQTGTQCRSHKAVRDAIDFIRTGKLGEVYMAKGLCYKPRGSIGHKPDGPVPAGVDFNI
jgi:predicted dehydrogenase